MNSMIKKKLDSMLVHAYWYDIKRKNSLDLANKIQVLALKNICKKFKVKNITISAGKISTKQTAIGYAIKRQLQLALPKKFHSRIHIYPNQKTTIGEIKKFREISQSQGWNRLGALGVSLHIPRIKRDFAKVFKKDKHKVLFFKSERNLDQKDLIILKKYRNSQEYILLKLNEQIENAIENVPIIGSIFLEIVGKFSINKGYLQPKIIDFLSHLTILKTKSKFQNVKSNFQSSQEKIRKTRLL